MGASDRSGPPYRVDPSGLSGKGHLKRASLTAELATRRLEGTRAGRREVDDQGTRSGRGLGRGIARALAGLATIAVITVASIGFGLRITPLQSVSALGQTVGVGVTSPTASLRGPGEVDLFGQPLPTQARFVGPIRPRLVLPASRSTNRSPACSPRHAGGVGGGPRRPARERLEALLAWEITFVAVGRCCCWG